MIGDSDVSSFVKGWRQKPDGSGQASEREEVN